MQKLLLRWGATIVAALSLTGTAGAYTLEGEYAGANYKIVVPDTGWNETLVVLAQGYRDKADHPGVVDDRRAMDPGFEAIANGLAAQGCVVAATSYRDNGWAVKESIHDITALRALFNGAVGRPETALLVGLSLGSFVAATMAERGGGLFDGYLPACGVLAGAPRAWDMGAAAATLALFGLDATSAPPAWPQP
jgi:hypothetical protein